MVDSLWSIGHSLINTSYVSKKKKKTLDVQALINMFVSLVYWNNLSFTVISDTLVYWDNLSFADISDTLLLIRLCQD